MKKWEPIIYILIGLLLIYIDRDALFYNPGPIIQRGPPLLLVGLLLFGVGIYNLYKRKSAKDE